MRKRTCALGSAPGRRAPEPDQGRSSYRPNRSRISLTEEPQLKSVAPPRLVCRGDTPRHLIHNARPPPPAGADGQDPVRAGGHPRLRLPGWAVCQESQGARNTTSSPCCIIGPDPTILAVLSSGMISEISSQPRSLPSRYTTPRISCFSPGFLPTVAITRFRSGLIAKTRPRIPSQTSLGMAGLPVASSTAGRHSCRRPGTP